MGFLGGGGNIAIAIALPPSFSIFYCKHQILNGISISYFYAYRIFVCLAVFNFFTVY